MHIRTKKSGGGIMISSYVDRELETIESKLKILPKLITLLTLKRVLDQADLQDLFNDHTLELLN